MSNAILHKIINNEFKSVFKEFYSLSNSKFNSLLLEIFNVRIKKYTPSELLKIYTNNRFVEPFDLDVIKFLEYELRLLNKIQEKGIKIIEMSPMLPLGSCSVLGPVSQKKILSSIRNTEVVADITNALSLEIARRKKNNKNHENVTLCSSHRLVRGQKFDFHGFSPHFKVIGLASSGKDMGNFKFETLMLEKHIELYTDLLTEVLNISLSRLKLEFIICENNIIRFKGIINKLSQRLKIPTIKTVVLTDKNNYYKNFRFNIKLREKKQQYIIVDGGDVDWTAKLLENKKERLLTSGLGSEFLYRILENETLF